MKILIVDDQPRVRSSLKALLAASFREAEVRQAADGAEAIHCIEDVRPDIMIMDARMPKIDGIGATRMIKARWQQIKVIVLSMYADCQELAIAAGADAFIGKSEPPQKLLRHLAA